MLTPLKDQDRITEELADKVNQVRHYRNWIAHGKREPRGQGVINLNAKDAFDRLNEFLETLGIAVESERDEDEDAEDEESNG